MGHRARRLIMGSLFALALVLAFAAPALASVDHQKAGTPTSQFLADSNGTATVQSQFYASMTTSPVLAVVTKRATALAATYTKFASKLSHIPWKSKEKRDARAFETYLRSFAQFLLTIKDQNAATMPSWSVQLTAIGNAGHKPFDALSHVLGLNLNASTPVRGTPAAPTATTTTKVPPTTTLPPPTTTATTRPPPAPRTTTPPTGAKTTFGDGTWAVGSAPGEVAAGTYQTNGGSGCYWERDSNLTGNESAILANDDLSGPGVVTILPTDAGFESQGCGTWSPLPATGPQVTSFGDGDYAVGIDIAPGTYTTSGGAECYWEQDSDYTGDESAIISNDDVSGPDTVTIPASTKAFETNGCGTWHIT